MRLEKAEDGWAICGSSAFGLYLVVLTFKAINWVKRQIRNNGVTSNIS